MGLHSTTNRRWRRGTLLAVAGGGLLVVAAAAVLVLFVVSRPRVSVSLSGQALVRVHVSGMGAKLTTTEATSSGRPLALTADSAGLVPAKPVAQGQTVHIKVTAKAPSWLHWLVGSGVSKTETVRTPTAATSAKLSLAPTAGRVPVSFDRPVSVVEYRTAGGPTQIVRLSSATKVAELDVPSQMAAGSLQVAAAPRSWETVSSTATTVTWFVAPPGSGPIALADPAPGTNTAASNGSITLTFDESVSQALGSTRPTLSPASPGTWSEPGPDTLVFTPSGFGFGPGAAVSVGFDHPVSVLAATGTGGTQTTAATASSTYHFDVAPSSTLRLEQILAQLHYLPFSFVPAPGVTVPTTFAAEVASMSQPLAGSLTWRWASTPAALQAQWSPDSANNVLLKGALMAFDANQSTYDGYQLDDETVPQLANASTWSALLQAAAANQVDPSPYSYVYVTKALPETLTLWQNGSVVLTSAANTGIPQDPTADGTYPIYVRYTQNYMTGTNPDGTTYDDLVYWINYFNGSDAVHAFPRASYGFPQSLGCVELPSGAAQTAFSDLAIGDLVTVSG